MRSTSTDDLAFVAGDGEMAARMRAFPWAQTPLGELARWPQPLKTLVGLMLASGQPMFMAWGPEQAWLYNDAFIPILGRKHPDALGRPALAEVWREAREVLTPMFDRVFAGESVDMQDFSLPLDRDGRIEEAHFAFCYTPARDESGAVAGLFGACIETTAQVHAERRQAAAQERQRRLFERAPSFMCILQGPEHVYEFVNNAHRKLFNSGDWVGKPVREAFPAADRQGYLEILDRVYATGVRYVAGSAPLRFRRTPDEPEQERLLDFVFEPMIEDDGRVTGIFCEGFDVSETRRAERAIRESEMRFREIADAAPVMIWISDSSKGCVWFNRPWLEFTGRAMAQEIGEGWKNDVHPDDLARCSATYHEAFDRRERYHSDYRLRRADGEWRIVEDTGVPRFSSDGAFLGYVGSCIDVTDQRAAQQAVRASEEQLRLATEAAEVGLWDVDVVTDTLFWPPRVKAMFGISPNVQVSMDDFYAGLHPEEREATSAAFAAAVDPARRALYDVEYRTVGKEDGLVRWVAAKGRGIFDGDGRCVRVIGTAIDITPRKLAEARLREREEHLRAVVETSPECVKLVARDGTLLQMNTSGLALLGAAHEGLVVGKSIYDLIAPEHREAFRAFNERICDGDKDVLEFDVIGLTGERRHMETHAAPLRMPDGACVQLAMTRDVTARREAEAALRESDRRKDEFIATLSHELRNPLAPLSNALEILRLSTDHADHARIRGMMERQVNHLVRLVDDLLEVSRINHGALELRRERVDLATVVRNAAEASEPLIRDARHELDITLPGEPVWLDGDPVRLAQILANLLNNAARYMAPGGRISVGGGVSGDAVVVSVRDHGVGFAPDAASHLFEMFGRGAHSSGLGIGLALARRLAEMHGGTIAAASEGPGRGAEFTLTLPHANAPADADARGALASAPQRQQRILVVDDNEDAADSTRMILELLGADVRAVHDGRDALAAFDAWHPDVVLLDIGMPGMDGYAVARALRAKAHGDEAFIVAVSGWGQARDRHQSREAGFDDHLVKPADFRALGQLLDDLQSQRAKRDASIEPSA